MYKPFEVFLAKKYGIKTEENGIANGAHQDYDEALVKWKSLSEHKRLKFIKKAEKIYDEFQADDKQPFHTYLTPQELHLLLQSYNMPKRPPPNSKVYCIHKYQKSKIDESHDEEEEDTKIKSEANENWNNLPQSEKKKILDEFHKITDDYENEYVDFVRGLPQQRVEDYKHYLIIRKTLKTKKDSVMTNNSKHKTNIERVKKIREKSLKTRDAFKRFVPHELYFLKMKSEESESDSTKTISFGDRNKVRSAYTSLSDKKKFKYIKKAENNYDLFDFSDSDVKPRFSFFLTRHELDLLLKSYGMPELVPNSLSGFFLKRTKQQNPDQNMDTIFQEYRQMSADEKERLSEEHKQAKIQFESEIKSFFEALPDSRLEDYKYFRKKNQKRTQTEINDDESVEEKKTKRIKSS